jgi:hypothetical protein
MCALPSFIDIAGHPIFMQDLHPTHLSLFTRRGGLCFTFLRSAQGLLEIITEGASRWIKKSDEYFVMKKGA